MLAFAAFLAGAAAPPAASGGQPQLPASRGHPQRSASPAHLQPLARRTMLLGRSTDGRPIFIVRAGNPTGPRLLVFGCVHGNETAGIAVARALERVHTRDDVWIVPDLNPDGVAAGTRQNAHGVDLNRNWSSQWQRGGRPWDVYYGGSHPFSERETRLARDLIERIHPRVTIWYHQHMDVVWAYGPSTAAGRLYARLAGMRLYHHPWLAGTATNWQNHHMPGTAALTIELPAGQLSSGQIRRHVRAVLALGATSRLIRPARYDVQPMWIWWRSQLPELPAGTRSTVPVQ